MSLLIEYSNANFKSPDYGRVINKTDEHDINSNEFNFDYIKGCNDKNVLWGSEKPLKETCLPEHLQMVGISCNNIWNNSTKRKTIVE
tara:strand:- start:152 stop:412 length:261 start_codon:yes stop_codon:yes gene_type:complete